MQISTKRCTVCKKNKNIEFFYKLKASKDGLSYRCISCDTRARNDYNKRHGETRLVNQRIANRKHKYNLSNDEYLKLFEEQKCVCAICGLQDVLQVDHDHVTGKVRGLLCGKCNKALGLFNDNTDIINNAISYLKEIH